MMNECINDRTTSRKYFNLKLYIIRVLNTT